MEDRYELWFGRKRGEKCVEALKKHGFDAHFVSSKEDAKRLIMDMISGYETFGFGGSITTRNIGILDELKSMGKTVYDHWGEGYSPGENMDIRLRMGRSECFLCSANAISATGEVINVDGVGNRTNAMTFGPKKVIIVAGLNKVTPDLDSAMRRVMEVAGPMRAKSLDMDTPCAATGVCIDCNVPQRICNITVILNRRPAMTDISIVIVNEVLGF